MIAKAVVFIRLHAYGGAVIFFNTTPPQNPKGVQPLGFYLSVGSGRRVAFFFCVYNAPAAPTAAYTAINGRKGGGGMKLKIIDPDHLLAVLTREEAQTLGIFEADGHSTLRFSSFHSRLAAARILSIACSRGFACEDRRITLQALPSRDESILLLFTLEKSRRRTFRIKHKADPVAYRLETADALLAVWKRLGCFPVETECTLYRWGPGYALVLCAPVTARRGLHLLLGEYGTCLGKGTALAAFVAEHGQLLWQFSPGKPQT